MKKHLTELMNTLKNRDAVYQAIAGELGAFGVFFGHKVEPKVRATLNRAWRLILEISPEK